MYVTVHTDGGTVSMMLAVLNQTKSQLSAIAPSAAGFTGKDLEAFQCRPPIPVMVMHGANDSLFRGLGTKTGAWWAMCNKCDIATTKDRWRVYRLPKMRLGQRYAVL